MAVQAVAVLGAVQQQRKVSAGLRLAAAALFNVLGAPLLAHENLSELSIKHIQFDTISCK